MLWVAHDLIAERGETAGVAKLFRLSGGTGVAIHQSMPPLPVETKTMTVTRDPCGIVSVAVRTAAPIDATEAEQVMIAIEGIMGSDSASLGLLVDLRGIGPLTPEAEKQFGKKRTGKTAAAIAYVGRSALDRALGNVLLMLSTRSRGGAPTKIFGNDVEARVWIQGILRRAPASLQTRTDGGVRKSGAA